MLRHHKPTRIELKKSDLDDYYKKKQEDAAAKLAQQSADDSQMSDNIPNAGPSTSSNPKARQAEIRRRLGFTPDIVPNDGTTGIHY